MWYVSIIGTALARRGVMKYDLIINFEMCNVVGKMRKKAGGMRNEIIQIGAVIQSSSQS